MNFTKPNSLIKIENLLRSMNDAENKVARFILNNSKRIMEMTISEVSDESGVSEATVFRLCRAIGYPGFRAFKIALAQEGSLPVPKPLDPVDREDNAKDIAHKVFNITVESLQETLKVLDYGELEKAYSALSNADKVLIIALSVSRTSAIFAAEKLFFAGINAQAEMDIHFQNMRAALLTPKDVLFAFSRSGDTRDIIDATKIAKERGATTIGVTNSPRSYFAQLVDIKLLVKSKETRFRNDLLASRIEHISIVDVLFTMLAARDPERMRSRYHPMHDAALAKQI